MMLVTTLTTKSYLRLERRCLGLDHGLGTCGLLTITDSSVTAIRSDITADTCRHLLNTAVVK